MSASAPVANLVPPPSPTRAVTPTAPPDRFARLLQALGASIAADAGTGAAIPPANATIGEPAPKAADTTGDQAGAGGPARRLPDPLSQFSQPLAAAQAGSRPPSGKPPHPLQTAKTPGKDLTPTAALPTLAPVPLTASLPPAPPLAASFAQPAATPAPAANTGSSSAPAPSATQSGAEAALSAAALPPELLTEPRPSTPRLPPNTPRNAGPAIPASLDPALASTRAPIAPHAPTETTAPGDPAPDLVHRAGRPLSVRPQPPAAVPELAASQANPAARATPAQPPATAPATHPLNATNATDALAPIPAAAAPPAPPRSAVEAALPAPASARAAHGPAAIVAAATPDAPTQAAAGSSATAVSAPPPPPPALPAPTAQPAPTTPAAQLAPHLAQAVSTVRFAATGHGDVTIQLQPAQLGAVQVHIARAPDGAASITVNVEKLETLQSFQQDIAHLHLALDRAGIPAEARQLSLHLTPPPAASNGGALDTGSQGGQPNAQQQGHQHANPRGQPQPEPPRQPPAQTAAQDIPPPQAWQDVGINITA